MTDKQKAEMGMALFALNPIVFVFAGIAALARAICALMYDGHED